ncbi:MAG: outer membrane lipoprotein carrier protein LolA [Phycisphaerales bacterium]
MRQGTTNMTSLTIVAGAVVMGAGGLGSMAAQPGRDAGPAIDTHAPAAERAPAATADAPARSGADELLARLEEADKSISSLKADIQYSKRYSQVEGGDKQIWRGTLYFDVLKATEAERKAGLPGRRRFAVIFRELLIPEPGGKMVRRAESKHLIFDGEWFVERNESTKQFIKRRVVKPGERIDPLRLGEGPFPLPIGQKREEILKRFTADSPAYDAGLEDLKPEQRERFANTVQLHLVPIGKTREARDLAEVRIWYRSDDLLPRLVKARTAEGAETEILLINHERNEAIDAEVFSTEPPKRGWDVSIRDDFRTPAEEEGVPTAPVPDSAPAPEEKER